MMKVSVTAMAMIIERSSGEGQSSAIQAWRKERSRGGREVEGKGRGGRKAR